MSASDPGDSAERIRAQLLGHPDGMHRLGEPATVLDSELPPSLAAVYREFDGGELFHESLRLLASREVCGVGGRITVGEVDGDDLQVDEDGTLWRQEKDSGEELREGSRFDRWLLGYVEAERGCYDDDGEFLDELFDESGEPTPDSVIRRERAILKRDRRAPAPRWRLAQALARRGELESARAELEQVVALWPEFAWAWFDLARASEQLGELDSAVDEAVAAAEATENVEHAGYFLAHAARLAARGGDDARRSELAERARDRDQGLIGNYLGAARACHAAGELEEAREHLALVLALLPGSLEALDLLRKIEA